MDALRLAGDSKDHVKLATRDERDAARTELALLALASQGASILIAGLDAPQAEVAAKFAERTHVPVILLSPLAEGKEPAAPAFQLGEPSDKVALGLALALSSRGGRAIAPIGGSPPESTGKFAFVDAASCTAQPTQAGATQFPFDAWHASKVDSLLLLGDAACASEVIASVSSQRFANLRVGVALDAAEIAAATTHVPLLVASAGAFPLRRNDASSVLNGFHQRHGRPPSFWAALGHDAAVLARVAERALPADRTEDAAEVDRRHRAASDALGAAEALLWSTSARGFASRTVIARDVVIFEAR